MQPNSDDWQAPAEPNATEPHAYVDPEVTANAEQSQPVDTEVSDAADQPAVRDGDDQVVRWQAAEYVHRDKTSLWYAIFAVVVLVMILVAAFLIRDWTFVVLIPVMAAALIVYVKRPPVLYDYTLSRKGLHINDRLYAFEEFKEFGLVQDDDQHSVLLVPRKRFRPGVTVYFPEGVGEAVVDMLAARLPMHEVHLDPIDRLIRFLRI